MADIREVDSITFGVLSKKEILQMSVCSINNTKKAGSNSVYDEKMGSLNNTNCITCDKTSILCTGHFGHINLACPILHPLYLNKVEAYLKVICFNCSSLLVDEEFEKKLISSKKGDNLDRIIKSIKKNSTCYQCEYEQPSLKVIDNFVFNEKERIETECIIDIFSKVTNETIEKIGYDYTMVHPLNFIIEVIPVLPTIDRPYIKSEGNICDDDLTLQYIEIIKNNNYLLKINENIESLSLEQKTIENDKREKYIQALIFRVATTFNNSTKKAKHTTNSRPIKSIYERLSGKDGQIRNHCMGKRGEQTARTVISPDPTLPLNVLCIPTEVATILTIPEVVTPFNFNIMNKLVNEDNNANMVTKKNGIDIDVQNYINQKGTRLQIGDKYINGNPMDFMLPIDTEGLVHFLREGKTIQFVKPFKKIFKIEIGDVIHRKLRDGDWVFMNRQPTLHRGSMLAMKIRIHQNKTFSFNLAICSSLNGDFDGDEINIYIPASYEAIAELQELGNSQTHIILASTSKPNIVIVQDSLLGAYKMTKVKTPITKSQFFDGIMKTNIKDPAYEIQRIRKVLKRYKKDYHAYNGQGLISAILPKDFDYNYYGLTIIRGVLIEGIFSKDVLGSSYNSIIQILNKEYGKVIASEFVDNIQFITNYWISIVGSTITFQDCIANKNEEIKDVINKTFIEAQENLPEYHQESFVNMKLNKIKDACAKITKDNFSKANNFNDIIHSGAKGNFVNITQITGVIGQQNLNGNRIPTISRNRGTIFHHPDQHTFEEGGFVKSNYIIGLNPIEHFNHAIAGRSNVADTALGTAKSGYLQRKINKLVEEIKVEYDNSTRNISKTVFNTVYNQTGIDPLKQIKVGKDFEFCDVNRLIKKLERNL